MQQTGSPQEGSPDEEAQETPGQEGQESGKMSGDPSKVISTVQQALSGIAQAVQGAKSVPMEAQKHVENAMNEYNAFMKVMGSAMGVGMPDANQGSVGNQPAETAGRAGAVPAGQPTRPGARPMMG